MHTTSFVLLLTAGVANAEPPPSPWTVTAGLGVAWSHLESEYYDLGYTSGLSLRVDVAYRIHPRIAIGIHGGYAAATGETAEYRPPICYVYDFDYHALELGVTAQLGLDRFWIAPWFGVSKLSTEYDDLAESGNATLGVGVAAGYGLYQTLGGHYIDVYTSAAGSLTDNPYYSPGFPPRYEPFVSFTLGVDFRY